MVLVALVAVLFVMKGSRSYERPGEQAQIAAQIAQQNGVDPADPRVAQAAAEYASTSVAERADLYGADLLRTLAVLALATGLVFLLRRGTLPAWARAPALALGVAVDLGGVAHRYLNKEALTPASAPEDLIQRFAYDDFVVGRVADAGGAGHFRTLVLDGGDLASSARPAAFYETLSGYHGAKLRLYQDYLDHILVTAQGSLNPNALPLMGVRYVVAGGAIAPGMAPVFADSSARMAVFETPAQGAPAPGTAADSARAAAADSLGALGLFGTSAGAAARTDRAWFASTVETLPDDPAVWARLQDPALDVHRTALVAAPTVATTAPIGPASTATARLVRYTPREIAYDVETDAPRLFVLSEVYYPAGWTATVAPDSTSEGAGAEILRVDHLLRGVQVPAGRHRVTLRFDPASYRTGLTVAGVSSGLVYGGLLLLLGLGFARRRTGEVATEEGDVDGAPLPRSPSATPLPGSDDRV